MNTPQPREKSAGRAGRQFSDSLCSTLEALTPSPAPINLECSLAFRHREVGQEDQKFKVILGYRVSHIEVHGRHRLQNSQKVKKGGTFRNKKKNKKGGTQLTKTDLIL